MRPPKPVVQDVVVVCFVNPCYRKLVDTIPNLTSVPTRVVRRERRTKDLHPEVPEKQTLDCAATNQNMDE